MVEFKMVRKDAMSVREIDTEAMVGKFWEFNQKINEMIAESEAMDVNDDESLAKASEMIAQAKKLSNAMSKRRLEITRPILEAKKKVDGAVNRLADQCAKAIRILDGKCNPYLSLLEAKRRKKEAEAQKAVRDAARKAAEAEEAARIEAARVAKEEAEALNYTERDTAQAIDDAVQSVVPVAPTLPDEVIEDRTKIVTDSGSTTIDYEYTGEIVDVRKMPAEAFTARKSELIKAMMPWVNGQIKFGVRSIPGVNITRRQVVKRRVR